MANSSERYFPWLRTSKIAHRGLFEAGTEREENTLAAIKAAVDAGLGIEIDVRITADDLIVVFHDETLDRMTNATGHVGRFGLQLLKKHMVGNSGKSMPTLPEALEVINGDVPLFIEIKSSPSIDIQKTCAGVRHCFEGYRGPVAVMSFDPRIIAWFKKYMPSYPRGWVIGREALLSIKDRILSKYVLWKTKPDFLACDINLLPNSLTSNWSSRGLPLLTWTVRTQSHQEIARMYADGMIFETTNSVEAMNDTGSSEGANP
ncbi:glycerophosphodiester phosphodiesterase family protein [Kordiimonas sp. SCSIO 12610]|uniref:glycerophosphodiester phosphodiesterase family protein n=1 Tax=Kordiimonas sp. SCSIO 12610 TaxID=2829597 RepID=UPI00210D8EB1|nr:glycerophosphodiester phosphodiesterase family protein [Kordiimonas sp. SCSIO 12610]UTW54269.1 hypothetical protein KFF44_10605 [Kordiimonas sp. SCSIO 12610]